MSGGVEISRHGNRAVPSFESGMMGRNQPCAIPMSGRWASGMPAGTAHHPVPIPDGSGWQVEPAPSAPPESRSPAICRNRDQAEACLIAVLAARWA